MNIHPQFALTRAGERGGLEVEERAGGAACAHARYEPMMIDGRELPAGFSVASLQEGMEGNSQA